MLLVELVLVELVLVVLVVVDAVVMVVAFVTRVAFVTETPNKKMWYSCTIKSQNADGQVMIHTCRR